MGTKFRSSDRQRHGNSDAADVCLAVDEQGLDDLKVPLQNRQVKSTVAGLVLGIDKSWLVCLYQLNNFGVIVDRCEVKSGQAVVRCLSLVHSWQL